MDYKVCGCNSFGQFFSPGSKTSCFSSLEIPENLKKILFIKQKWCYNLYFDGSSLVITGICLGKISNLLKLTCPFNLQEITPNLIDSGDDENLIIVDSQSNDIWVCNFIEDDIPKWRKVTPFLNVEVPSVKSDVVKIVAKGLFKLCLTSDGSVYQIPQRINTDHCDGKIVDIDCGNNHGIFLTSNGSVYTVGHGRRCQLGHGDLENREEPHLIEALAGVKIKKISAGGWHCCALSETGDLYTWGSNEEGQLGLKITAESKQILKSFCEPKLVDFYRDEEILDVNVIDISCGSKHTMVVLSDNSVWASGCNKHSQCGIESSKFPSINFFIKVYQSNKNVKVECGHWSSIIIEK